VETIFPGLKESEKAAAGARTRIEDGKAGRLYVRGGGLTPGVSVHFHPAAARCRATASSASWRRAA
jgi:GTP pyrophosphokinase/guanosine-3',5'-bis(diphosphate) 3'-pyrophosphohydrolase